MDRFKRNPSGRGGIVRALQKQKKYVKALYTKPATPRQLLRTGEQFKSQFTLPVEGESFARRQIGISSKSRVLGGGRFDYNRPSAGYLYGEK